MDLRSLHASVTVQNNSTEKHAEQTVEKSLKLSGLSYIDLYLIHSPYPDQTARLATWRALERAVERGQVRSIGVSNYAERHLKELLAMPGLKIKPAVNQIDVHPFMRRSSVCVLADHGVFRHPTDVLMQDVKYCQDNGIQVMAWGPLARGYRFGHSTLKSIASKHKKSEANVLLRWSLQNGCRFALLILLDGRMVIQVDNRHLHPQIDQRSENQSQFMANCTGLCSLV